jgi:hypothetical protein
MIVRRHHIEVIRNDVPVLNAHDGRERFVPSDGHHRCTKDDVDPHEQRKAREQVPRCGVPKLDPPPIPADSHEHAHATTPAEFWLRTVVTKIDSFDFMANDARTRKNESPPKTAVTLINRQVTADSIVASEFCFFYHRV